MDKTIIDYLSQLDSPNRESSLKLLEKYRDRFFQSPGSSHKHQSWLGGYIDHLEETMMIAERLYNTMDEIRHLDFSLSDVIIVLFLHDLEKPFKYCEPYQYFGSDSEKFKFIRDKSKESGIELTDTHLNAIQFIHGEGSLHNSYTRIQSPLSAFCHMCDVASARIWFDFPKNIFK